jgi:hypothetical protein
MSNFTANGPELSDMAPLLGLLNVFPTSVFGFSRLKFLWTQKAPRHFSPGARSSNAFTPAAYITTPHFDGAGYAQMVAQLEGAKLWIVWPVTKENLFETRRHLFVPYESLEYRLEVFLQRLQNPMVYLARKNDSFLVPAGLIHACISITTSVHYGDYFWIPENFEPAVIINDLFIEKWSETQDIAKKRKQNRLTEDWNSNGNHPRSVLDAREKEDAWDKARREFYESWKSEWKEMDRGAWKWVVETVRSSGSLEKADEIDKWAKSVWTFLSKLDTKK